ncbi:hypothetical protein OXX80_003461 [Metschnikowia pulcherrima]|nr:hypothetical protein OY671_002212 [Metschnikowia pulcherrima]
MSILEEKIKYVDLLRDFKENSTEILPSKLSQYQSLITILLAIISFVSLASTLLNRKGNFSTYLAGSIIASISIALTSIYACNFFGVYI